MLLAIDASNIRTGGGVTHLVEVLRVAQPAAHGIEKIFVWACAATLARIEDRPWLEKRTDPALEGNLWERIVWQRRTLNKLIRAMGVNLLFVPGGSIVTNFHPTVTMSRNMLPFEWIELRRFGLSAMTLRLLVLRANQTASFKKADGTIFLTRYAYDAVTKLSGVLKGKTSIVPHGTDARFRLVLARKECSANSHPPIPSALFTFRRSTFSNTNGRSWKQSVACTAKACR